MAARRLATVFVAILVFLLGACGGGRTGSREVAQGPAPTPVVDATSAAPPAPATDTGTDENAGSPGAPAQTPEACLERAPARPAEFEAALRRMEPPWLAADLSDRVALGDDAFVWIFGDTIIGDAGPDGRLLPGWSMVRSSAVIQIGGCFDVVETFAGNAWIPAPSISGRWRWPQEALVLDGELHVFAVDLAPLPSGVFGFEFETVGGAIATYPLDDLRTPRSITTEVPAIDGNPFGFGPLIADGWLYLYAHGLGADTFAARVDIDHLHTPEQWTFWDGSSWVPDVGDARSVSPHHLRVFRAGAAYGAVSVPFLGPELHLYESSTPFGPWVLTQTVALEHLAPDVACYAYQPLVIDPLVVARRADQLTIGVNFLPRCLEDTLADINRYGPEFITVDISE